MGKVFVVLLATLFVCGIVSHFVPGASLAAFDNKHGVTYMMLIGMVSFVGTWRLVGGK